MWSDAEGMCMCDQNCNTTEQEALQQTVVAANCFSSCVRLLLSSLKQKLEKYFYLLNDLEKPGEILGAKIAVRFCKTIKLYRINEPQRVSSVFMAVLLSFCPPSSCKNLHLI